MTPILYIPAEEFRIRAGASGPPRFTMVAYTGGLLRGALRGPEGRSNVVIDLRGMVNGNSLIANLDHDSSRRVGHIDSVNNTGKQLILAGALSAVSSAKTEVLESHKQGFKWQASVEADPEKLIPIAKGTPVRVNGQTLTGPFYLAVQSTLKGVAFLSHGADDNTVVSIAASASRAPYPPRQRFSPDSQFNGLATGLVRYAFKR